MRSYNKLENLQPSSGCPLNLKNREDGFETRPCFSADRCAPTDQSAENAYSAIWMRVTFMALARVSWWGGMCSPVAAAKVLIPVAFSNLAARLGGLAVEPAHLL